MFKHQSSFFVCMYYWIRMDLGSLILKGPQCLCKTFELRQGQPKIVISGPLYSYALESFNARWTPIAYDVSIRSIVLRWTQSFPIEWTNGPQTINSSLRPINVGWTQPFPAGRTSGPLQCDEPGSLTVKGLFRVLWSGMDSALPSRKDLGPS